jgi:hypothetical protein
VVDEAGMKFESRILRTNAVLALIAAAVFLFIMGWERHTLSSGELRERRGQLVTHFVRDRVTELRIEREDGEVVLVRERAEEDELGDWLLRAPIESPTDIDAVDTLLGAIEWATPRRTLEGIDAEDARRFGLTEPRVRLRFRIGAADQAGSAEHTLSLGVEDPQGGGIYAQLDDSSVAYVVGRDLVEALDHDANHLRAKEVFFDFGTMQSKLFEIERAEHPYRLEKRDGRWHVVEPFAGWASERGVRAILTSLADIKAARFVDETPDDLGRYGLADPSLVVTIERDFEDETRRAVLRVGGACGGHEGEVYARTDEGPVVCVPSDELEPLAAPPEELRELRLVTREDEDVDAVVVERGGSRLELTRGDDGFTLTSNGDTRDVDEDALAGFMESLRGIRAIGFLPADDAQLRGAGLVSPSQTITIRTNDEPDEVVQIGARSPDGIYARRGDEPAVIRLAPEAEELLEVTPLRFRALRLVEASVESARELRVQRGTTEEVVVRDGDDYRLTAPIAADAESADVRMALTQLTDLEALRFVADAATAAHALARPRIVATVSLEASGEGEDRVPAAEHTLRIGAATDDGAYATLDDDPAVFVVSTHLHDALSAPLLSRSLLATDLPELAGLTIESGASRIELTRDGATLTRADGTALDADTARAMEDALSTLRAAETVGYGPAPAQAALATPRARITVTRTDNAPEPRTYTILVGAETTDAAGRARTYARRDDLDATFLVATDALAPLTSL